MDLLPGSSNTKERNGWIFMIISLTVFINLEVIIINLEFKATVYHFYHRVVNSCQHLGLSKEIFGTTKALNFFVNVNRSIYRFR